MSKRFSSRARVTAILSLPLAVIALLIATGGRSRVHANPGQEMVQNGGFEEPGTPLPRGWFQDTKQTGNKGSVSADSTHSHSGQAAMLLRPNSRNTGVYPLAIAQVIPAAAYRGKKVEFSAYVMAEQGATAVLGMLNFVRSRPSDLESVSQGSGGQGWVRIAKTYDVPDDASVQLVVTCFVNGTSGAAWFDDVSVVLLDESRPGSSPAGTAPASAPGDVLSASLEVDTQTVIRNIPRTLYGANVEWIWNGNLLWQDREHRPDPELVRLAREMGVTLVRYPGGHLSDFYHWHEGVGPAGKRPETLHEAGKNDKSPLNFGTDEALEFAQEINGELLITVNAGSGTPQEAADWVRYVNGRGERVRYWEIGNELYMNDGSPVTKTVTMDPNKYAARLIDFAKAMRAVDPNIKIGAIGGENYGRYKTVYYPEWDRIILQKAGDQIDFLAVHNAYAPAMVYGDEKDFRAVYQAMLAAPILIQRNLNTVAQQIAQYAPARASKISIAVTEWGPLFSFDVKSRYVDQPKSLGSALFAASVMKAFIDSPHTEIANCFLLNDVSVLGWIGSRNGNLPPTPEWAATARLYAFELFTRHFGDRLVTSKTISPTYNSEAVGLTDAVRDVPYLDVAASLSPDGRQLYIIAINKNFDSPIKTSIALQNFKPTAVGEAWTLKGASMDANTGTTPLKILGVRGDQAQDSRNPRFYRGGADEVTLSSSQLTGVGATFAYQFPQHSVTSLVLTKKTK